jgi:hypothetical protein
VDDPYLLIQQKKSTPESIQHPVKGKTRHTINAKREAIRAPTDASLIIII